jgi:hypothetical protein
VKYAHKPDEKIPEIVERDLWAAVIQRAVLDATGSLRDQKTKSHIEPAREWFRRNGRDYRSVCALAGVDPDALRDRVLAKLEAPAPEMVE